MDIEMIKKLIELDKKACEFIEDVKSENAQSAKSLDEDKNDLYNNYMTRAEKRIDKARLMAIEQENEKRNLCQKNFEEISQGMDKIFEEKKEQWVQDLFEKCIE